MDTGTFLIIAIGVTLAYKIIMKLLEVVNNAIEAKRFSRTYRNKGVDIDFDDIS